MLDYEARSLFLKTPMDLLLPWSRLEKPCHRILGSGGGEGQDGRGQLFATHREVN